MPAGLKQTKTADGLVTHFVFVESDGVPWHRLGKGVKKPLRAMAALGAIDGNYLAHKVPTYFQAGDMWLPSGSYSIVGPDNVVYAPAVTDTYTIHQFKEAAQDFDRAIGGKAAVRTAGLLADGAVMFMSVLMSEVSLKGLDGYKDHLETYLVMVTGHDGKTAYKFYITVIRTVCQNTQTLGERLKLRGVSLRHAPSIKTESYLVTEAFARTSELVTNAAEALQVLLEIPLEGNPTDVSHAYSKLLFPVKDEGLPGVEIPKKTQNLRDELVDAYVSAPGQDDQPHTTYRLNSAATWLNDNVLQKGRWAQTEFGEAAQKFRDTAYEQALVIAGRQ